MVKTPKYFDRFNTARELVSAIKNAPENELFFRRDTMKYFGPQKFRVWWHGDEFWVFSVHYTGKYPRVADYRIDENTLKIVPVGRYSNNSREG